MDPIICTENSFIVTVEKTKDGDDDNDDDDDDDDDVGMLIC